MSGTLFLLSFFLFVLPVFIQLALPSISDHGSFNDMKDVDAWMNTMDVVLGLAGTWNRDDSQRSFLSLPPFFYSCSFLFSASSFQRSPQQFSTR